MSIQHNKKYQSLKEYPLSTRTNTQIKKVIKEILIPYLIEACLEDGMTKKEAKESVHKLIGKNNKERIQKIRTGIFDSIYKWKEVDL